MKRCDGCTYWELKQKFELGVCSKGVTTYGVYTHGNFFCKFHRKIHRVRTEKKKLKDILDDLHSKFIIASGGDGFGGYEGCWFKWKDNVTCGGSLQNNHIVSRANYRLRWDSKNCCRGCAGHNLYYEHHEGELHNLIARLLPEKWEYLQMVKHQKADLSKGTLTLLKIDLERKLRGVL